jgi:hypothetical protein
MSPKAFLIVCCLIFCAPACHAGQFKVSQGTLERTLKARLFGSPDGRYYLRGDAHSACVLYAEDPHVSFSGDRILVHVHAAGTYGTQIAGRCLGVPVSMNTVISLAPSAEGEVIGVRDARLDRVSDSPELNFILTPFLSHKIPSSMSINAANMLRQALAKSTETSGYTLSLDRLQIRSMQVKDNCLLVDFDGDMSVN